MLDLVPEYAGCGMKGCGGRFMFLVIAAEGHAIIWHMHACI